MGEADPADTGEDIGGPARLEGPTVGILAVGILGETVELTGGILAAGILGEGIPAEASPAAAGFAQRAKSSKPRLRWMLHVSTMVASPASPGRRSSKVT